MLRAMDMEAFLAPEEVIPIVDVRSPAEFTRGHIPGAVNLPLFSDEERARVGTLYKQQGRDAAVLEGLRHVGPRMADLVIQARQLAPHGRIGVHCWRGGERSASVAWLLDKAGFPEVRVLRGGYKMFRRHVLRSFEEERSWLVLGGHTGSGKTLVLRALRDAGQAVLDLEAAAHHKGSAFGGLGQPAQPSQEHFENVLWHHMRALPCDLPVWIEDESRMIGRVQIPDALYAHMRSAPLLFLEVPLHARVERLVAEYGGLPPEGLSAAIRAIEKRMGPQHARDALLALETGDLRKVANRLLAYYDKTYDHGRSKRTLNSIDTIPWEGDDLRRITKQLIAHAGRLDRA